MGYYNPIFHFGINQFCSEANSAGVDGLIVPDLPPEEADELMTASKSSQLSNVFLIAPTSADERIRFIDSASTDFSYCVSVTGVTGMRDQFGSNGALEDFLGRVKANTKKKFVVGFGISKREHVERVWHQADGAVVGSALISAISESRSAIEIQQTAKAFLKGLRS
jgi:tryptophan synthase alpha chain